jgi:hypothetical protein
MSRIYVALAEPIPVRSLAELVPGVYERDQNPYELSPVIVLAVTEGEGDYPLQIIWSFINEVPAFSNSRVSGPRNMFADDWKLIGEFRHG